MADEALREGRREFAALSRAGIAIKAVRAELELAPRAPWRGSPRGCKISQWDLKHSGLRNKKKKKKPKSPLLQFIYCGFFCFPPSPRGRAGGSGVKSEAPLPERPRLCLSRALGGEPGRCSQGIGCSSGLRGTELFPLPSKGGQEGRDQK